MHPCMRASVWSELKLVVVLFSSSLTSPVTLGNNEQSATEKVEGKESDQKNWFCCFLSSLQKRRHLFFLVLLPFSGLQVHKIDLIHPAHLFSRNSAP